MTGSAQPQGSGTPAAAAPDASARVRAAIRPLLVLVLALLGLRLLSLGLYPLWDTSEARYGEIARVMLETGNWVTPQETPGTPFWAKPPLYAWLSVLAMQVGQVSEFWLRLPSWLCALGVLVLTGVWARSAGRDLPDGPRRALTFLAPALLAASAGFFAAAGAVMTDPVLVLCTTLFFVSFQRVMLEGVDQPAWRLAIFVAAGLGMLAKGPVLFLFAGLPVFVWCLARGRLLEALRRFPLVPGLALFVLLSVPWYALAEMRTPGFLRYFLLGEHFGRFLVPGWKGDMYGTAHAEPLGTIWVFAAASLGVLTPLCLALAADALRRRWRAPAGPRTGDGDLLLALLGALLPLLVFTFAGNIIWTYTLPSLAPAAVLMARLALDRALGSRAWTLAVGASLAASAIVFAVLIVGRVPRYADSHSAARLVERWRELQGPAPGELWYWGRRTPASLRFYARGAVHRTDEAREALDAAAAHGDGDYLVTQPGRIDELAALVRQRGSGRVQPLDATQDLVLVRILDP